ncbi:MAG: sulfatase-like hydrolase/transferase [Terriglobales bacterium]
MSVIRQWACVLCLAASALAGTAPPPNIILITIDTTRADRMGFLGSKRGLTPNLDALARASVVFTRAYSQAPLTAPSHATILTGTYPQFHQVNDFGVPLAESLPFAPAILKAQGYRTAAFVGALALDPEVLVPGFGRGFDTYDAGFAQSSPGADRYHSFERRGGEVVAHALAWLNKVGLNQTASRQTGLNQTRLNQAETKHPRGPFFMWVHLYDAHDPYDPPEPYKTKYASAPYDGEIAYADSALGKLLSGLRRRGLYNGAVIALMADHGESLGDHGEETHGFFLYDETIHVPLVIKLPGAASAGMHLSERDRAQALAAGRRVDARVGLVDVLPTILQAAGIAVPQEVQGESLLALMEPKPESAEDKAQVESRTAAPDRQAYAETDYGHDAYGWSPLRALRTGKYLYIKAPRQELYDQSADPKAEHDLSITSTAVTSTLAGRLDAFRQQTSSSRETPKASFSPEARQKLAALGYVATDPNAAGPGKDDLGADPKDKIEVGNLLHRANMLREEGHCDQAVPVLRQLTEKEPGMAPLYMKLGQCFMLMNDYTQAVPVMRKYAQLDPESADAHYELGGALVASQDFAAAVPELELAVAKIPRWERARLMLANAYTRTARVPEAIKQYDQVLEVAPDDYVANLLLGRTLLLSGDATAALPKLKKATALQPKEAEPHLLLSQAYLKMGRFDDAAREQFEAQRLGGK